MARLPYLDPADLAPENRDLLARNVNIYRAMTHSPDGTRSFLVLANYIRHHSRLDPRLREMAILQVGYATKSPYEYSHHIKIGHAFGVSDDDIRAIVAETEGRDTTLAPIEKAVLRAAREMVAGTELSDATFEALEAGLDKERIVDLLITISFYCGVVRFLGAVKIDVEDDYRQYLEAFPLPT
ncbi:MAG: carboxymuconolactone decarboxylase family protein [Betaproteobacteria bacterium]|nr:carboxymuconolactone decarboxylase family protein [Betaproteobacteria bacterium]